MSKIGRNEPCPCLSGKKYKHCHSSYTANASQQGPLPQADIARRMRQALDKIEAHEYRRRLMMGLGQPIVSFEHKGYRFVSVGMDMRFSRAWKTFPDFLLDYMRNTIKFDNAELAKPEADMHPIILWFKIMGDARKKVVAGLDGLRSVEMNGASRAFLGLAYDLFLCAHNVSTQELLIKRLQNKHTFWGALYEASIIGWFVRAGFTIEFEDETDPTSKHCEFIATHKMTGRKYSVEAKAIANEAQRAGASPLPPRVRHKLTEALHKNAEHPRVVFIDLNRAENPTSAAPAWETDLRDELEQSERDMVVNGDTAPPAYVFMTNRGFMHKLRETDFTCFAVVDGFKISDYPIGKGATSILEHHKAREKHIEMFLLTKAMVEHDTIPMTFDGQTPEEAFAPKPIRRLTLGEMTSIGLPDGTAITGMLLDATVEPVNGTVHGVLRSAAGDQMFHSPLSPEELAIYKSSPDTFFNVVKPVNRPIKTPLDCFDFMAASYSKLDKATLLVRLAGHPNIDASVSRQELSDIYVAQMATSMWVTMNPSKPAQAAK